MRYRESFTCCSIYDCCILVNFRWPFHRDYLLSLGVCDVSKESITHICTKQGTGNAAIIVIGGAAESLEAYPGAATLMLKNRKGFVKMALKTGYVIERIHSYFYTNSTFII